MTLEIFYLMAPHDMLLHMLGLIFNFKIQYLQGVWFKSVPI